MMKTDPPTMCPVCDRPDGSEDGNPTGCEDGCVCERCESLCWGGPQCDSAAVDWRSRALEAEAEALRLDRLINTPHTEDFLQAVTIEAAHQRERWPEHHDLYKKDADWLWLIGALVSKAVHAETQEKKLHHIVTSAAVCCNWHRISTEDPEPEGGGS